MKLVVAAQSQFDGGEDAKREYGCSTLTKFCVYRPEDRVKPSKHLTVVTGGKTLSQRTENARVKGELRIREMLVAAGLVALLEDELKKK